MPAAFAAFTKSCLWAIVVLLQDIQDPVRTLGVPALADALHPICRLAALHQGQQGVGFGVAGFVLSQALPNLAVGLDDPADRLRSNPRFLMHGSGGDQSLNVDDVRIEQQSDEGLGVVGIRLDVGEHDHAVGQGGIAGSGSSSSTGSSVSAFQARLTFTRSVTARSMSSLSRELSCSKSK